ncbi:hypothetical protein U717_00900 [Rhodobacter capsulatus R121]|nr:hypothetical protein U717_00900 [Rhodobacter capsulatus R121]ETE55688.1 hypothetical protein U715_00890 [Rhodobacter capsulatus Y262]
MPIWEIFFIAASFVQWINKTTVRQCDAAIILAAMQLFPAVLLVAFILAPHFYFDN